MPRSDPPSSITLHLPLIPSKPSPIASSSKSTMNHTPSQTSQPSLEVLMLAQEYAEQRGEYIDIQSFMSHEQYVEWRKLSGIPLATYSAPLYYSNGVNGESQVSQNGFDDSSTPTNGYRSDPVAYTSSPANTPGSNKKKKYNGILDIPISELHWTQRKKRLELLEAARLLEAASNAETPVNGDGENGATGDGGGNTEDGGGTGPATPNATASGSGTTASHPSHHRTKIDPEVEKASIQQSASYWNHLLIQARKDRGPQWDYNTQSYQIDRSSKLYYSHLPKPNLVTISKSDPISSNSYSTSQGMMNRYDPQSISGQRNTGQNHPNPLGRPSTNSNVTYPPSQPVPVNGITNMNGDNGETNFGGMPLKRKYSDASGIPPTASVGRLPGLTPTPTSHQFQIGQGGINPSTQANMGRGPQSLPQGLPPGAIAAFQQQQIHLQQLQFQQQQQQQQQQQRFPPHLQPQQYSGSNSPSTETLGNPQFQTPTPTIQNPSQSFNPNMLRPNSNNMNIPNSINPNPNSMPNLGIPSMISTMSGIPGMNMGYQTMNMNPSSTDNGIPTGTGINGLPLGGGGSLNALGQHPQHFRNNSFGYEGNTGIQGLGLGQGQGQGRGPMLGGEENGGPTLGIGINWNLVNNGS